MRSKSGGAICTHTTIRLYERECQGPGEPPAPMRAAFISALGAADTQPSRLGRVADGLDVVSVRVAHECAVVVGVVFRPDSRLVQHFGASRDGGGEEFVHRSARRRSECDVAFAKAFTRPARAYPEIRLRRHSE